MRAHQQHGRETQGHFLTPTVNSYRTHLAAVKSVQSEKLIPRPLDIRFPNDFTKTNMDAFKATPSRQDSRLAMYGKTLHIPVLGFAKASPGSAHALTPPPVTIKRGKGKRVNHSAELTYTHSKAPVVLNPVGDPVAPNDRSAAGFPVDFSCKNDNPVILDRLDFDRRGLMELPNLVGMNKLRFLNLQHNLISHLPHLSHLRHLVFLDLYDNHLIDMTAVSPLCSLRVLMLGKNRIQRVCGLDSLKKLDVLDLHENQVIEFNVPPAVNLST